MMPLSVEAWQVLCGEITLEQIVDLRQPERFARGHMPGARNLPYEQLQARTGELDPARSILVVDPGGARAAEMATWLRARGFDAGYLEGGLAAWTGPLEKGP